MSQEQQTQNKKENKYELAASPKMVKSIFDERGATLRQIAANNLDPKRLARIAMNSVIQTPNLARCTTESLFRSVVQAAELGLEAGGGLGRAYLVPYGNKCQLIIGYKGLCDLAYRSGLVLSIESECVYQGDGWIYKKTHEGTFFEHEPRDCTDPKLITHAYCVIKLKGGGFIVTVMTKAQVDAIRARSKSGNSGPWVTDYAEMAKKTVLRRALKTCPMSIEMQRAERLSTAAETGEEVKDFETMENVWDVEETEQSRSEQIAAALPDGVTMQADLLGEDE